MNRLFGYGSRKTHDEMLMESNKAMEGAQEGLQKRISSLDTQITQLNIQLQNVQNSLTRSSGAASRSRLRQQAMKLLSKRKQLEAMRDSLDSQSWSMSQAQMVSDNVKNTMVTVNALQQTNKALRAQYGKLDIDKLQDMQDEMADLIEQGDELQDILAAGAPGVRDAADIDEDELDAELEALAQDEVSMGIAGIDEGNPSYLSDIVPQFIDAEDSQVAQADDRQKAAESVP